MCRKEKNSAANEIDLEHSMFLLFEEIQENKGSSRENMVKLLEIYETMNHEEFMRYFLKGLETWLTYSTTNSYAKNGLQFMIDFLTSFKDPDNSILLTTILFISTTTSPVKNIRYRLHIFIEQLLSSMQIHNIQLADSVRKSVVTYCLMEMGDSCGMNRVRIVYTLRSFQNASDPDDPVIKAYKLHLKHDPHADVRLSILQCMKQCESTVSAILDRLTDIDQNVRHRVYLIINSIGIETFSNEQRLEFLEKGLNDPAAEPKQFMIDVLLPNWFQTYEDNCIAFLSAILMDSNEDELNRFLKVSKQILFELFKNDMIENLAVVLPFVADDKFQKCVEMQKLSIELAVYWHAFIEYAQRVADGDSFVCEENDFSDYLMRYLKQRNRSDTRHQHIFFVLAHILSSLNLSDEIANKISNIFSTFLMDESTLRLLVLCVERIILDQDNRYEYFIAIIHTIIEPGRHLLDTTSAQEMRDQNIVSSQSLNGFSASLGLETASDDWLRQCLIICFYAVCSKRTTSLTPDMFQLYEEFVQPKMESENLIIRHWALKCGITMSRVYGAKPVIMDIYCHLYTQFELHRDKEIWETCIHAIFEMIDQFGFAWFEEVDVDNNNNSPYKTGVQLMGFFGELIDSTDEILFKKSITIGFCRLILSQHYETVDLLSRLLLSFFNPTTEAEVKHILQQFIRKMILRRQHKFLAKALLPAVLCVYKSPENSPIHRIQPCTIIRFLIEKTKPSAITNRLNVHNDIATAFLNEMINNVADTNLLKMLAAELTSLEISQNQKLRDDLKEYVDHLLKQEIDKRTEPCLKAFNEILAGTVGSVENLSQSQSGSVSSD